MTAYPPATEQPVVFLVDDEEVIRDSVGLLLKAVGIASEGYPDALAFLSGYDPSRSGCLLVDVRMPRMSGLELQRELNRRGYVLPLIFISGHADVPMAVEAMREGAMDFVQKPFNDDDLIRRLQRALEQDRKSRELLRQRAELVRRYETLTAREREVAQRLVDGAANKVLAIDLGVSERTVELHRSHIMHKMEARSLALLVKMLVKVAEPPR